ncbi:heparinase II/III family protein [Roseivivax isoporae]|uniref:Heparinase II/III family protein n=1 Tax=Roseivivax isoporae LMG 25204 TaxID=1449351 RepID=X7FC13_9RHOB|nr:heparinase II/III family protein [Roseivivax isoporae]ETX30452.1 heparinase II/III family protein [Roseivivax isoporae LMG 25204]
MSRRDRWQAAATRYANRYHAWRAVRARPATAFRYSPEPRAVGSLARGRQLCAGNLLFAGHLVEAPGVPIWDVSPPDAAFEEELHGFGWLDDLAAASDPVARATAQAWVWGWIDRFGDGRGAGWLPDLAGRRILRMTHHTIFLLHGQDCKRSRAFHRAMGAQTLFLARRWPSTRPGLPRFEALAGLVYAALSLEGMEPHLPPALKGLEAECGRQIDEGGGIPTRNPEELLEIFTLLAWVAHALDEAGQAAGAAHRAALRRIAPTLRALRHSDGGLARFHGGGRGAEGWLDMALATSGVKPRPASGLAMGFARLSGGRTSVIVDAAAPPAGAASLNAHASTLAFELTSGRRPLIVSCGAGAVFGSDWRRAGRATPSHSALCLDGYSSARLGGPGHVGAALRETLEDGPTRVPVELRATETGQRIEAGHDGYAAYHGLTHARQMELTRDGRGLVGEDMLVALTDADKRRFGTRLAAGRDGIPFQIRFHLHPEVDAELDMAGGAVSLALPSGEVWVLRHDHKAILDLEASVYLEKGRLRPRASKQVVLSGRAMQYATRVRWSIAKARETAIALRDVGEVHADAEEES